MDVNREYYEIGLPIIEKAGVAHKIDFREGPALSFLDELLKDENNMGTYDFVFVDADKNNYLNYHKRVIELVRVGGLIGYDNTLWFGSVALPSDAPMMDFVKKSRGYVMDFNKHLASDPRIEICQIPVGDGITLCRRIL
ncbi:Caffeoyl-CoA O-methyltransferase 5 [Stylosanthes scabra]|uniref:Caffeoyl-CoA O-methyltransferase 5 n=1 Tax=Stylosanthes scabra TaxID=79078 RepID=A0ABU6T0Z3_9FABA|nr:Caffeoyl-CoA O-methyltransferase 5 [Stylosanthes scabra]